MRLKSSLHYQRVPAAVQEQGSKGPLAFELRPGTSDPRSVRAGERTDSLRERSCSPGAHYTTIVSSRIFLFNGSSTASNRAVLVSLLQV